MNIEFPRSEESKHNSGPLVWFSSTNRQRCYVGTKLQIIERKSLLLPCLPRYNPALNLDPYLMCSLTECKMADWHANERVWKPGTRLYFPESVGLRAQTQGQAKVNGLWYGELFRGVTLPCSSQQLAFQKWKKNRHIKDGVCPEQIFTPWRGFIGVHFTAALMRHLHWYIWSLYPRTPA